MWFVSAQGSECSPSSSLRCTWNKLMLNKEKALLSGQLGTCGSTQHCLLDMLFCELCHSISYWFCSWYWKKAQTLFFQMLFVVEQELCYWIKMHSVVSCRPVVAGPCARSAGKNCLPVNF